jgi:cobalt-zinc-cadmium efflux system membrane fusion protein
VKHNTTFVWFAVVLLAGCGKSDKPVAAASGLPGEESTAVKTITVSRQNVADTVDLAAKVQADPAKVIHIFPPASGRVVALQVRPGDRVKQGQTIAILESSDIASARSDFEKAKIESERSERAAKRASLLFEHEVMAEKDYEDARAQADSARSELARAQQRLRLLGAGENSTSDRVTVTSPRMGVVLDIGASPGELSKSLDSSSPIATIADLSTAWIVGDVYEKDLAYARPGSPVNITLEAYPGESWKGTVASVSDALDPNTRTLKLRVVLENPEHRLKPEMFATIHLTGRAHQAILVPATAVVRDGDAAYVFARSKSGSFDRRTITLGETRGDSVEITSGLSDGDMVVTEGSELLRGEGSGE